MLSELKYAPMSGKLVVLMFCQDIIIPKLGISLNIHVVFPYETLKRSEPLLTYSAVKPVEEPFPSSFCNL